MARFSAGCTPQPRKCFLREPASAGIDPFVISLGAIDLADPVQIPELVRALDEHGYTRYWTTEHHGPLQSGSPIVAAAIAAAASKRIRVGTAGVMLRYYQAARIRLDAA